MSNLPYAGKRLLQMIPVLIGITMVTFLVIRLVPGNPALVMLGPKKATPETIAAINRQFGLDQPLPIQYVVFLKNLAHGDLGTSFFFQESVLQLVWEKVPATLFLILYGTVLSVVIMVPMGLLAALHKDRLIDQIIRATFLFGLGLPSFWLGLVLILVLSVNIHLFPVSGYGNTFPDHLWRLFLPALTIAVSLAPILIRSLRNSVIDTLRLDHVLMARAKGLREQRVMRRHVLRNALISTVTILGINIGFLIGGTVVIENIFSIPGLGYLMLTSISTRDYPVVQGLTLVFAVLVILVNLVTDVTYAILDPRVTYD